MALDTFDTGGDRVVSAPCGCRLLVNGAGEWVLHAPCRPDRWDDWGHIRASAIAAGLSAPTLLDLLTWIGMPEVSEYRPEGGWTIYRDQSGCWDHAEADRMLRQHGFTFDEAGSHGMCRLYIRRDWQAAAEWCEGDLSFSSFERMATLDLYIANARADAATSGV